MNLINVVVLIPFVRNMIEYGEDKNVGGVVGIDKEYILLTHLLHEKDTISAITFDILEKDNFKSDVTTSNLVIDMIYSISKCNHK